MVKERRRPDAIELLNKNRQPGGVEKCNESPPEEVMTKKVERDERGEAARQEHGKSLTRLVLPRSVGRERNTAL